MIHLKSCHCCGLVQTAPDGLRSCCVRCATRLESWLGPEQGNRLAASLALAALVLYLPAVSLPFLRIERLGHVHASSLVGGVRALFAEGYWFVGAVVLVFSIVLPVFKLSALLVLSLCPERLAQRRRAAVYRSVEHLGRWGMLDVLLVAVMVAFVKLGGLVNFGAGPGLATFALFALLSLIASAVFDPYALWDEGVAFSTAGDSASQTSPNASEPGAVELASIPRAVSSPPRKPRWWVWGVPAAALVIAGWLGWDAYADRGRAIVITFREGHGIAAGDELRYLGIVCGEVEQVRLASDLAQVEVKVRLTAEADRLARAGARFWIVRPQADLTGVAGLETVVGPNYLTLLPGEAVAPTQTEFTGLETPPLPDLNEPGGLEIVLQSPQGTGLRRGLAVLYRGIRIGGIMSADLAADGSAIEARAYIRPRFRHLVRANSVFWNSGGIRLRGSLTELSLHIGTAETLLRGGVAMALPPEPGPKASTGHRFILHERPEDEWLEWQPAVAGKTLPLVPLPRMSPAELSWTHDGVLFDRPRRRSGWVLPARTSISGPRDLLSAPADAVKGSILLTVAGQPVELPESVGELTGRVLTLPAVLPGAAANPILLRRADAPEDILLVTDRHAEPLLVAAVRLIAEGDDWRVDESLPIPEQWHGAAAVAVADGALVGRLICADDDRIIVREPSGESYSTSNSEN